MRPITLLLAFLFVSAPPAGAEEAAGEPVAEQVQGEVTYRTGGVGRDERAHLEKVSSRYNLKMIFAEKDTLAFVADVRVRIVRGAGEAVLEAAADGPWFLVRLPAGRYDVTATVAGGSPQSQSVEVPASGQAELRFYWPAGAPG